MDKPSLTQFKKAQIQNNQPMRGSNDIYKNFQFIKILAHMVRLCLKNKWNETFSPTQVMNENKLLVDKWLGEQVVSG